MNKLLLIVSLVFVIVMGCKEKAIIWDSQLDLPKVSVAKHTLNLTQCNKEGNKGYFPKGRYTPRCKPEPAIEIESEGEGLIFFTDSDSDFDSLLTITPIHTITICNEKGQEANIDFSGDKVIYSGDLPIDESAKLFFKYVFGVYQEAVTLSEIKKGIEEIKEMLEESYGERQ